MTAIYDFLFSAGGYSPHGYCLAWEPGLLWLHVLSNGLIALAYFSIPIAIFRFVARRRDLPRRELAWLFAAFILSCGLTHVSAVATLFVPVYGLEGVLKAVTAAISLTAALGLFLLMPELLRIPSRSALMEANARLANEVRGRTRAEDALQAGKAAIEQRVAERTRILSESEERQRLALESAGYGVWDWQIGQDTVYWAETNRRLLGYSQAEFPNVLSSWR
ncbi:MAG: hybrid sensor histidine kinase/response regulator, partial [Pseudomonadota bacterium]